MSARELQRYIKRLVSAGEGGATLNPVPAVGARAGGIATGRPAGAEQAGGGGEFVEADYLAREYWPPQALTSSDGLFVIQVEPIRSILLESGERAEFAEPVEPEE